MEEREWLPVRCCCTPVKILGFLSVPKSDGIGTLRMINRYGPMIVADLDVKFARCNGFDERAIYSEERPIEFWRQFDQDFMEVKC